MTTESLHDLRKSFQKVEAQGHVAALVFYRRLFEIDSSLRPLFRNDIEAQKAAYYQGLLADAPHAKVESISPARHFVMLDQPAKFQQVLGDFLKSL